MGDIEPKPAAIVNESNLKVIGAILEIAFQVDVKTIREVTEIACDDGM